MSQQVQKLFDTIAPKYDLLNSLLSLRVDSRWRKEAVRMLKSDRSIRVMDLCAGTLALTIALLKENPRCHVTAVDFSESMLKEGWKNLPVGLRPRVQMVVQDAMKLDPEPASYDAVLCAYGMRNVDNNQLVLEKLFQAIKPGGRIVILEFFRPEGILSRVFNLTYSQFIIPALGKLVSRHPTAYRYLRDSVRNFYTVTAYRELLRSIGFHKVHIKAQTGGVSHLVTAEKP